MSEHPPHPVFSCPRLSTCSEMINSVNVMSVLSTASKLSSFWRGSQRAEKSIDGPGFSNTLFVAEASSGALNSPLTSMTVFHVTRKALISGGGGGGCFFPFPLTPFFALSPAPLKCHFRAKCFQWISNQSQDSYQGIK